MATRSVIGFIGLGDMGFPMVGRLLDEGHKVIVWNRTHAKAEPLADRGAVIAESPAEVVQASQITGLCLTSHQAVQDVARAIFTDPPAGDRHCLVDFSTGAPDAAIALAREADAHGLGWVDAPVSGGVPAARSGKLTLFVGGRVDDVELATPLLEALSAHRTMVGGPGAGQTLKLCNQMIVGTTILTIAETIAAARRIGVDVSMIPGALRGGFADSAPLQLFGSRMAERNHEPRLGAIALMAKDLRLALDMTSRAGAETPIVERVLALLDQASDPDADLSRLVALFEKDGDAR